jgi:poly-gamma-glutamate synthesis protein (capsule biosynthesis protein)
VAKKKKKIKVFSIVYILLFFAIAALGVYIGYRSQYNAKTHFSVSYDKIDTKKEYNLKLMMVGDALIHDSVYKAYNKGGNKYDFTDMFKYMKDIVKNYDLAYYNQETILGGTALGLSNYPMFNSPQEVGDAFIDAGFNTVSLATNHTMDKGEAGVLASVDYWKKQKDVAWSGQWSSEEERTSSIQKVYEVNGIKYAFISYTIWNNGLPTPPGKDYLSNEYSPEKATADIQMVRDKADFVIVAMHWGTEYSWKTDYKQDEIAAHLSNLGVDLIIGAHPHVVQTVEYINNNKTFVIYSLGNFISDQMDVDNFTGLAMEVTLRKHMGKDGKAVNTVVDPKAELIYTVTNFSRGYSTNFRVKPYPMLTDSELPNHNSLYEKYKGVVNECYPNLTWGLTWE